MPTQEFTRERLAVVHRAVVDAIANKDAAGFAALYEQNGYLLPPTGEVIRGRAAITATFQDWLERGFCGQRVEVDELAVSGDLAMEAGRAFGEFRAAADGATEVAESTYLIVHRRQPGGSWLMARDIWTAVPKGT